MKKCLLLFIIIIPYFLFSYTIEETLSQIESLKEELFHNEQIVKKKISDLKKSNPLFADHDPFESSAEYAERLKKGQPIIDNIRKQYLDDLWQKLGILRGRMFETENVTITLGKYNPDTQQYPMKIQHLYWQKETYNIKLHIEREKAKTLYQNWDKVKKTGIRTIDIGDKIGLAKIQFIDPVNDFDFQYEFQPMISLKLNHYINSATFSPDGKILAVGFRGLFNKENFYIYDLINKRKIKSFGNTTGSDSSVYFSKDSKLLFVEMEIYSPGNYSYERLIYDLCSDKILNDINKIDKAIFSKSGDFICTIDIVRDISPDGKYEVRCGGSNANIYRTFAQVESEVFAQKIISRPPSLSASVSFNELSGNQYLDALEKGDLTITVTNNGKGPGKGLTIKFYPERIEGLNFNNSYIEEIPAGKSVTVKIPIEAYIDVKDETHLLRINFDEINGFPPAPVEIQISTKSYVKPELFIVDVGIEDNNNNGMIESGETTKLTVRIGNKGKGIATGSYAKFYSEDNVFITDSYPKVVSLGDIEYNQHIDVPLEFFVNDKAADEIPLYVDLTEATGISGVDHLRIPILKSERTRKIQRTVVTGIDKEYGDLGFGEDLSIDIEENIPAGSKKNDNILAIVFGIEDYKNVSDVSFAHRDARFIKEYFGKTLGIKENNIYYRANEDVSKAEFDKVFSAGGWLDKRVKEGKTEIYFYYAGHGAPDIKQNKAYLIPYDGDPNYASQTGYEMEEIYDNLADLKAKSVTVFLDACFTGANRESEMLLADARPLMIEVKSPIAHGITVFSATGQKEISSAWREKKHGLFSYFLMKGMQGEADVNNDNKLTLKELGDYIQEKVSEQAGHLDREQTPQMISNDDSRILINY